MFTLVRWTGRTANRPPPEPTPARKTSQLSTAVAKTVTRPNPTALQYRERPCSTISGRAWVIDGDTIVIDKQRIRLFGIDAPELDQPYGKASKWAMVRLCKNRTVTAHPTGHLSHERIVAVCKLDDGRDLSAEIVRQGLALDWPTFSQGKYRSLEPFDARKRMFRTAFRCT